MMLIGISAAHGRHALTRVWAKHTASLGFDKVVVSYTEGDAELFRAFFYNDLYCFPSPNYPLAGKFNAAMSYAMECGATRIMILPSDDFISHAWVKAARETEYDYIVPHACGIYDLQSGEAFAITKLSLNPGGTLKFGAGRVISRKAVEACQGELWPPQLNKGLDSASHARLHLHGIHHKVVTTEGIPITDVKTKDNLWPFGVWKPGAPTISEGEALHMLSEDTKADLLAIRSK